MIGTLELLEEALVPAVSEASDRPACLAPWLENPYGLVSLWDFVYTFDAGRLCTIMGLITGTKFGLDAQLKSGRENTPVAKDSDVIESVPRIIKYCDEMGFSLTAIPLRRLLKMAEESELTLASLVHNLGNALERLRDEAGSRLFFRIATENVSYYRAFTADAEVENYVEKGWMPIFQAFPSTKYDATEAFKTHALGRSTACVFHLMRVLELGLTALGGVFGVSLAHTNWAPALDQIEKQIREMHKDPTWKALADCKEQQEFYAQTASHFGIFKDAWRNYTAHARGKYDEQEALDILNSVRAFMQKLSQRLHE